MRASLGRPAMPILPLVDLFILFGTGSFAIGALLKAIEITTHYHPSILGFSSADFALITGVCFAFALTLVARTWLKLNEPRLLALQSRLRADEAQRRARELDLANGRTPAEPAPSAGPGAAR
jgi:hypothetical protein